MSPRRCGIWADGLGRVLDRLNEMLAGTPLLVVEYGAPDQPLVRCRDLCRLAACRSAMLAFEAMGEDDDAPESR